MKPSAPGHRGMSRGVLVAGRDDDLARVDVAGRRVQPPAAVPAGRSAWTAVPSRSSIPPSRACRSRCATTWSRVGNMAVPFGYGRFGRCENCLPVLSFEPVVAAPPGRTRPGRPGRSSNGAQPAVAQAQRRRDTCRARTDDAISRSLISASNGHRARPFSAPADGRRPTPRAARCTVTSV